jgi:hypothetical protein
MDRLVLHAAEIAYAVQHKVQVLQTACLTAAAANAVHTSAHLWL